MGPTLRVIVTATNGGGSSSSTSQQTVAVTSPPPSPPSGSVTPPKISGTATIGHTLTVSNDSWTVNESVYSYQWKRDGVAIAGATGKAYTVEAADQGRSITYTVTASDGTSSTSATAVGYARARLLGRTSHAKSAKVKGKIVLALTAYPLLHARRRTARHPAHGRSQQLEARQAAALGANDWYVIPGTTSTACSRSATAWSGKSGSRTSS